jgi:transposase InsO family protein
MLEPMKLPLPRHWTASVKSATLHVIAFAHYAMGCACNNSQNASTDLSCDEVLLREVQRIKDARMARVLPQARPHYTPQQRMEILEMKAAQGWSLEQTARTFQVTAATVSSWMKRIDEDGTEALVQLPQPVNKFPQFVGHLAQRLKTLCPTLGKRKIAAVLARAGLHLSATSVRRMLNQPSRYAPPPPPLKAKMTTPVVTARRPHHVWHVDLTVTPTRAGFWCPWLPNALPQCWPFGWWIAVVIDHYSRRVLGTTTFYKQPTSEEVRAFLGRTIQQASATPNYLICDRGSQFDNGGFHAWCRRRGIRPRYGAIGKHGSIAVVERFIRTLKECKRPS